MSIMSFPILDGLFVYVCMREWEGLELLLSGRMVWPQTQPVGMSSCVALCLVYQLACD